MHRQADTDFNLLSTFKNNHTFTSERVSVEGCRGDKTSLFEIDVNKNSALSSTEKEEAWQKPTRAE